MAIISRILLILLLVLSCSPKNSVKEVAWIKEIKEVKYFSNADSTYQPALIYSHVRNNEKRPLLVALHTWSGNYKQTSGNEYAKYCVNKDWYLIHPDFRGPNNNPKAMGSEYVIQDIVSAVKYMKKNYAIDESRVYLVGYSGGGHAALLMAGKHPEIWAGISTWNGISDIKEWWEYNEEYAAQIEVAVGGRPDISAASAAECLKRSPLTYIWNAKSVKIDINAGIEDETVPFTHSLLAYNKIVNDNQKISTNFILEFYESKEVPTAIQKIIFDNTYGNKFPLFRKTSDNARVTIFKGGHEIIHLAALKWLSMQQKDSQPVW